ncbi:MULTISPECIES: hypothetical protein [unclassified Arsukibacterium]|uniref:hypothetical protein n=1 Tax=unclassified Arsukibacterium TaxID=2635278 RepID=UPI000C639FB1|nr:MULTISPECIES: hypothetical protein [unclassified Arsukibacterium]MAA95880.1 hypothetical protein [Rheinheimera sp.]MBM32717.1 hypothetical protein [Rheinheimera sp.]HAW91375.1 hypothetical protein [Candidatus Azambacteria bacterium]|tara:strand:- start:49117 stop:50400 length:1284 start_codon:yes stop_codon:yes gene_type:complete
MTLFKVPILFIQLGRMLTILEMSVGWWFFIAFFWFFGFASNASLYIANIVLFMYYYARLLPAIAAFMTGSYGRLLLSKSQSALIPFLLISVITLLTSPGVVQYTALLYPQALLTLFCSHLLLHTVVFADKGRSSASGLVIFPVWLVLFNPQWFLQTNWLIPIVQPLPMILFYTLSLFAAVYLPKLSELRRFAGQQPDYFWYFRWRAIPKFQPTLAASYLFRFNARPYARLLMFSAVCAAVPLLQSAVHYWYNGSWQWFPELDDWKVLNQFLFLVPLIYWLYTIDSATGRTKAAWLYLPESRNKLFYLYERHFSGQFVIFTLPVLVLLYCWQPQNPVFFISSALLLSKLLCVTYLMLCFPNNTKSGFILTFLYYSLSAHQLFAASQQVQIYSAICLLLAALALRYFAINRWKMFDYSQKRTNIGQRHV